MTGQPIAFTIGTSGQSTTNATIELIKMIEQIILGESLLLSDKEHFTIEIMKYIANHKRFDILMPALETAKLKKMYQQGDYKPLWAGYSMAESQYYFDGHKQPFRMLTERNGEVDCDYKSFITTSNLPAVELVTESYPERWTIEDFFNFEGDIGLDRASTMNLNIRYGKLTMALMAQAAIYQFRQKLPEPYKQWEPKHLAQTIFERFDGDIRVNDDTILATLYNVPKELNLEAHYVDLPKKLEREGINPKIPWLHDYKVDFRFK
jgi:hypothetical protein